MAGELHPAMSAAAAAAAAQHETRHNAAVLPVAQLMTAAISRRTISNPKTQLDRGWLPETGQLAIRGAKPCPLRPRTLDYDSASAYADARGVPGRTHQECCR